MSGLARARSAGLDASYTYIVGLDTLSELRAGVTALQPHITDFPNFQVYQAHNSIMAGLRSAGAAELDFYLEARCAIEAIVAPGFGQRCGHGGRTHPQAFGLQP